MSYDEFEGLVAVVTGGGAGIGLATARELARRGAVVASLDRAPQEADGVIRPYVADVTSGASIDAAIAAVVEELGGIDVVINNAGVSAVGTVEQTDEDEWRRVWEVNVMGTVRVSAAALPWLRLSDSASVVNVCSIAALNGLPQRAAYSATKGAVLSLTYAMATDHVGEGIRVNAVSPGTVSTPFVERMLERFPDPDAERAALNARQATGRMVSPEEVADAIVFVASPRSRSITGTAIDVDGGVTHLRVRRP